MPSLLSGLPRLYASFLPSVFESEIPDESKATCSNCAMCEPPANSSPNPNAALALKPVDGGTHFFRPDTKCCTYHPNLPNFLVGAILADESPDMAEGRKRIREKIRSRIGLTPFGIDAPAKHTLFYQNTKDAFGRTRALLCPYFIEDGGLCSVWKYRESVCSTYFCKYVSGADGLAFWRTTKKYLALAEYQLARWTTLDLYPDYVINDKHPKTEGRPMAVEDLDNLPPTEATERARWGEWFGQEEEFFIRSYQLVSSLDRDRFVAIMGLDSEIASRALSQAHRDATTETLPTKLQFNPMATVQWLQDGSVALGSYSPLDALALPGVAYSLLVEFKGNETVEETRARLRKDKQADLSEEVLMELYRHRVLTQPRDV